MNFLSPEIEFTKVQKKTRNLVLSHGKPNEMNSCPIEPTAKETRQMVDRSVVLLMSTVP